jgi:CBS domain-containing protein
MHCNDIMKTNIACAAPQASVQSAARTMRDHNIGFLPVCDEHMHVIGAITDRDIAMRVVANDLSTLTAVESLMTREVVACRPDDDLDYARELMARNHKSRIMCIGRDGRLEGIISLSDVAQFDENCGRDTLRRVSSREISGFSS